MQSCLLLSALIVTLLWPVLTNDEAAWAQHPNSIKRLTSSNFIRLAQQKLNYLGYYNGPIDGEMSRNLRKAIEDYQDDLNIHESGEIDYYTAEMMGIDPYRSDDLPVQPLARYEMGNPQLVLRAQQLLKAQGYYKGKLNGMLTARTEKAIVDYQLDHELEPTGHLDPDTLARLGIGYQDRLESVVNGSIYR